MTYLLSLILLISSTIALGGVVHGRTLTHQRPLPTNLATQDGDPNESVPILQPQANAKVHCSAIVRTKTDRKYIGSNAVLSINKPKVKGDQWSTARIKLSNGADSIEAGWMVYPAYFKDNEAHLYARYNSGSKDCLNCPDFVQVNKDAPLGSSFKDYSVIGGKQFTWNFTINKLEDGNWWLSFTSGVDVYPVGHWPSSLLPDLKDAATRVEWGGEINNPGAVEPAPEMGNSLKATDDERTSAYFEHITVINDNAQYIEPDDIENFADCGDLYTVADWGHQPSDHGHVISYGGPLSHS